MDRASRTTLDALEAQLQELYKRVVDGDRTAASELAELIWRNYGGRGTFVSALQMRDQREAREEVLSIVGVLAAKFVAALITGKSTYDPGKGPLGAYINLAFKRDILNEADKAQRRPAHHTIDVVDDASPWNPQKDDEDEVLERIDLVNRLAPFAATLSPEEKVCFDLMLDGVRDNEPYAEALGITHLPIDKQRRTVNAIKDRLKKRLRRLP